MKKTLLILGTITLLTLGAFFYRLSAQETTTVTYNNNRMGNILIVGLPPDSSISIDKETGEMKIKPAHPMKPTIGTEDNNIIIMFGLEAQPAPKEAPKPNKYEL